MTQSLLQRAMPVSPFTTNPRNQGSFALPLFDEAEVRRAWGALICPPTEIRIIDCKVRGAWRESTYSGFFDDVDKLIPALSAFTSWSAVWFIPNAIDPALIARRANRFEVAGKGDSTNDSNIIRRRYILLDTDPTRVAGVSSTNAEHDAAIERMRQIVDFLAQNGWPECYLCDSGNGGHADVPVDLPVDDGGLIAELLQMLSLKFSDGQIKLDTANFNPARAWKMPGTMACKGDNFADRPHRMARIISAPDIRTEVTANQIGDMIAMCKAELPPREQTAGNAHRAMAGQKNGKAFDLDGWMQRHEPAATGPENWPAKPGGRIWTLDKCAFDPNHDGGCAIVGQMPSGALFYECRHNSCQGRDWKQYREMREPNLAGRRTNGTGADTPSKDVRNTGSPGANNGDLIPLGHREPSTGKLVLSSQRTLPTAEAAIEQFFTHEDGRTLNSYGGGFLKWKNNRHIEIEEESLRQKLQPWLHDALQYKAHKDGPMELVPFPSNPATIKNAVESIRSYVHLPATLTPPIWLDNRSGPDPRELLPTPSGNLHIPTGRMHPPTPLLFNFNATDFQHDPNAPPPPLWLAFLNGLWAADQESIDTLQEIFGYLLVADNSQQKMFLLAGPKRSGKGTIARVLTRLVGAGNVVGPTTSSLAMPFGLQTLIGKSVAIVSDARFTGESVATVIERLLCISGGDTLSVDQKFKGAVTMTLGTRFMFLSNELPKMNDASGALAGRFIVLRLTQSFYGREDTALTSKLLEELPGILNWAIEGLKRLRVRGHFVQPTSAEDAIREMEDLASPVGAFVRDYCDVGPAYSIPTAELFSAWQSWCKSQGRDRPGTVQRFGRDLRAAVAGLKVVQPKEEGLRSREYHGIDLNSKARADIAAEIAANMDQGGHYVR